MPISNRPCRRGPIPLLAAVTLAAGVAAGCSQMAADTDSARSNRQAKQSDRLQPQYDKSGKLEKLEYDRDGNGKVDTWGYMDGARVVRVEVDENGDGMVDRWEFHRQGATASAVGATSPEGVDRTVERIERSTRFDGKVSRWEHFSDGTLTAIEEDTNGDGRIDKWETYEGGSLSTMALDTAGRGTPDRRLVYRADGSLDRIEADKTGSGTFTLLKP